MTKKIIVTLLILLCLLGCSANTQSEDSKTNSNPSSDNQKNVGYYFDYDNTDTNEYSLMDDLISTPDTNKAWICPGNMITGQTYSMEYYDYQGALLGDMATDTEYFTLWLITSTPPYNNNIRIEFFNSSGLATPTIGYLSEIEEGSGIYEIDLVDQDLYNFPDNLIYKDDIIYYPIPEGLSLAELKAYRSDYYCTITTDVPQ